MENLKAKQFLAQYGNRNTRLQNLYDEDEELQSALLELLPDFEYPDYAHRTIGEIVDKLGARKTI